MPSPSTSSGSSTPLRAMARNARIAQRCACVAGISVMTKTLPASRFSLLLLLTSYVRTLRAMALGSGRAAHNGLERHLVALRLDDAFQFRQRAPVDEHALGERVLVRRGRDDDGSIRDEYFLRALLRDAPGVEHIDGRAVRLEDD